MMIRRQMSQAKEKIYKCYKLAAEAEARFADMVKQYSEDAGSVQKRRTDALASFG